MAREVLRALVSSWQRTCGKTPGGRNEYFKYQQGHRGDKRSDFGVDELLPLVSRSALLFAVSNVLTFSLSEFGCSSGASGASAGFEHRTFTVFSAPLLGGQREMGCLLNPENLRNLRIRKFLNSFE